MEIPVVHTLWLYVLKAFHYDQDRHTSSTPNFNTDIRGEYARG
jgi:hypothetical protein